MAEIVNVKLALTVDQVFGLVEQLPETDQQAIYDLLSRKEWARWAALARRTEDRARMLASERGLDWSAISDDEREAIRGECRRRAAAKFLDELDAAGNREELTPAIEAEIVAEVKAVRAERKRRNASSDS